MIIWNYDRVTGEPLGSEPAQRDPIEGNVVIPAYATTQPPPPAGAGYVPVFSGGWSIVEDHRGKTVYSSDGSTMVINQIGPIPSGWHLLVPIGAQIRRRKLDLTQEVAGIFNRMLSDGYVYNGILVTVNSDAERLNHEGLYLRAVRLMQAGQPEKIMRYMDDNGVVHNLTVTEMLELLDVLAERTENAHFNRADIVTTINLATSLDELNGIDITAGWPE